MDGLAKFVGYIVLVLIAIGLFQNWREDKAEKDAAATASTAPLMAATAPPVAPPPVRNRCNELETAQRAQRLAPTILERTGNMGENLDPVIKECKYFVKEDATILNMEIGWNGPLTRDYYLMSGRLTLTPGKWEWATTGANENLNAWQMLQGVAKVLAAGSDSSGETNTFWLVCLINRSETPVNLAYRWASDKEWTNLTVKVGYEHWMSSPANADLLVQFDNSLEEGIQEASYRLKPRSASEQSCRGATTHVLKWDGPVLKLFNG